MRYGITFIDGGYRPAIAKEGRLWTQVVFQDGSRVRVKRTKSALQFRPLGNGYTLRKFAIRLLRRKNSLGIKRHITKGAKDILLEAKEN